MAAQQRCGLKVRAHNRTVTMAAVAQFLITAVWTKGSRAPPNSYNGGSTKLVNNSCCTATVWTKGSRAQPYCYNGGGTGDWVKQGER